MDPTKLDNTILALLFASEEPLSARKIAAILEDVPTAEVHAAVDALVPRLKQEIPSIMLEQVAGGFQLSTNPEFGEYIARLYSGKRKQRLSKAAMETLAIIAYKQPITRADIENIRGVGSGGVVTTLMERSLIKIVGKAKVLGAPFLYGTTAEFLEYLGLNSLKDLPSMEELESLLEREEMATAGDDASESVSGEAESEEQPSGPAFGRTLDPNEAAWPDAPTAPVHDMKSEPEAEAPAEGGLDVAETDAEVDADTNADADTDEEMMTDDVQTPTEDEKVRLDGQET